MKEKAELFNVFFTQSIVLLLTKKTCKSLSTVEFSTYDILKISRNLNPNKTHGHDMTSVLEC